MLLRLGIETQSHHGMADEDRLAALTVKRIDAYRALLVRIFGFESSVERAVLRLRALDPQFIEERLRSRFLSEDLRALGFSASDIAAVADAATVSIDSATHGMGWLFVIERQMLLSGLIHRQLRRVFGDALEGATSYWTAYGPQPGVRFRSFAEHLSSFASRHSPKEIVAGASEAFRAQRQWYATATGVIPQRTFAAAV